MYFSNITRHDLANAGGAVGFQPGETVVGAMSKCSIELGSPLTAVWTGAVLANNCDLHTQCG
eukprot:SAG31_NODE_6619_length_1949_cov_1.066486_1_plen_61_part_10